MTSTASDKMVSLIKRVKEKSTEGFSPLDVQKISFGVSKMLEHPETIMGAIVIGRMCPPSIQADKIVEACERYNPLLLDELFNFPGIDTLKIQRGILLHASLTQAMLRMDSWYGLTPAPVELQSLVVDKIYKKVISEIQQGPENRQELSKETGDSLVKAISSIGNSLTDTTSVFKLLGVTNKVMRGMARQMHHQLPENFAINAIEAAWAHNKKYPSSDVAKNMAAFTLSIKDIYPEALNNLKISFPEAAAMMDDVWHKDAKTVREFLNNLGGKIKPLLVDTSNESFSAPGMG